MNVVVVETANEISNFADLALKNRLYVSGWMLSGYLINARANPAGVQIIALALDEEKPIGVAIVFKDSMSAVFVKKLYRRQNVGTELVRAVCQNQKVKPEFQSHDERSSSFFETLKNEINICEW